MSVMTAAQFNQDSARAKRDATQEPVFISTRGTPTHVLLSMTQYQHLTASGHMSLLDAMTMGEVGADIEWELPRRTVETDDRWTSLMSSLEDE